MFRDKLVTDLIILIIIIHIVLVLFILLILSHPDAPWHLLRDRMTPANVDCVGIPFARFIWDYFHANVDVAPRPSWWPPAEPPKVFVDSFLDELAQVQMAALHRRLAAWVRRWPREDWNALPDVGAGFIAGHPAMRMLAVAEPMAAVDGDMRRASRRSTRGRAAARPPLV